MKIKKALSVIVVLLVSCHYLSAQRSFTKGYIINLQHDTVWGEINDKNWDTNPQNVEFKGSDGQAKIFNRREIMEFGIIFPTASEVYRTKILDIDKGDYQVKDLKSYPDPRIVRDTVLATLYESGTVSLYYLKDENGRVHFLVEKKDTGIQDLGIEKYVSDQTLMTKEIYRSQLTSLMSDCGGIITKIGEATYDEKSMMKLVSYYNNCVGKNQYQYGTARDKIEGMFGVMAEGGFRMDKYSSLNPPPLTGGKSGPSLSVGAGMWVSAILPRTRKRLEICGELAWNYFMETGNWKVNNSSGYDIYTANIAANVIKINGLIRYSQPIGKVKLVFSVGSSFGTTFYSSTTVNDENSFFGVMSGYSQALPLTKFEFSLILGAGINVKRVGIELRYSIINSPYYNSLPETLNLTILYGFSMAKKDKKSSK